MTAADAPVGWLLAAMLAVALLPGAIGLWIFAVPVLKAHRMRRAGEDSDEVGACIACGAGDLEAIATEVFRCPRCGFVSGSGVVAWRRRLHRESLDRATAEERIASAAADLQEARRGFMAAPSLLGDAARRSARDILGLSLDRGRTKLNSFGAAMRTMRDAADLASEAFERLGTDPSIPAIEGDANALLLGMNTAWLTEGLLPDVAVHLRIRKASRHAATALQRVEAALASLQGHQGHRRFTRVPFPPPSSVPGSVLSRWVRRMSCRQDRRGQAHRASRLSGR